MADSSLEENLKNTSRTFAISFGIIGLILGSLGGYFLKDYLSKKDSTGINYQAQNIGASEPKTDNKAADLRVSLNNLSLMHVEYILALCSSAFTSNSTNNQVQTLEDENTNNISKLIGIYYGADNESKFKDLWKKQNSYFIDYAKSLSSKDNNSKNSSLNNLNNNTISFGDYFNNINKNLSKDDIKNIFNEQNKIIINAIDSLSQNKQDDLFSNLNYANNQIAKFADTFASSIVKQFPDKF